MHRSTKDEQASVETLLSFVQDIKVFEDIHIMAGYLVIYAHPHAINSGIASLNLSIDFGYQFEEGTILCVELNSKVRRSSCCSIFNPKLNFL